MISTTSRRALLTAAAAIPAVALLPVASTALAAAAPNAESAEQIVDPVIALAKRAMDLWAKYEAANKAYQPFDKAMSEWRRKNPEPKIRATAILDTNGREKLGKCLLDEAAQADHAAAKKDHLVALKKWERRKCYAQGRTGYRAAQVAELKASADASDAIDELRDTLPESLTGLFAKARVAHVADDDELAKQVV